MFTTPCFIKRISFELKEKLKELGYRDVGKVRYYGESQYIYCEGGIFYESPCMIKARYNTFIDCGDNEELFITLASLRDDSDINQYFICDKVSFTLGKTYYPDDYLYYQYDDFFDKQNWHKATVEELIEHFNKE